MLHVVRCGAVRNPFPETERVLFSFDKPPQELAATWLVGSDSEYGGQSTAQLEPCPDEPVSRSGTSTFVLGAMQGDGGKGGA